MVAAVRPRQAKRALVEAGTIDEIRAIRDKAEAARKYAASASLGLEIQNYAAEIKLRAERKAGELLAELRLCGGDRRSNSHAASLKLEDIGVNKDQSSRWQLEAGVPDEDFESYVAKGQEAGRELTSAGLVKMAKRLHGYKETIASEECEISDCHIVTRLEELVGRAQRFACIYADPPWRYGNQGTRAATENHYQTMPVCEICEMPVGGLAEENAHLHLWTTNGFLFDARLAKADALGATAWRVSRPALSKRRHLEGVDSVRKRRPAGPSPGARSRPHLGADAQRFEWRHRQEHVNKTATSNAKIRKRKGSHGRGREHRRVRRGGKLG